MVYAASIAPRGREARAISVVLAGPILAGAVGLPLGTALVGAAGLAGRGRRGRDRDDRGSAGAAEVPARGTGRARDRRVAGVRDESARRVLAAALFGALALVAHFAVFTFVSPLSTDRWGFAEDSVGALLLVFGIAGAVGLAASGFVGDRLPTRVADPDRRGAGAGLHRAGRRPGRSAASSWWPSGSGAWCSGCCHRCCRTP